MQTKFLSTLLFASLLILSLGVHGVQAQSDYTCSSFTDCIAQSGDEETFVAKARLGDTLSNTGSWELAIRNQSIPNDPPAAQENFGWVENEPVDFEVTYNPSTGKVTHIVGDKELTWTYSSDQAFEFIAVVGKAKPQNNVNVTNLTLNGEDIKDITTAGSIEGQRIPIDANDQQNGFKLNGTVTLSWNTTENEERPALDIYPLNAEDLPEPTGTIRVCKIIANDGTVVDGSNLPDGTFTIPVNGTEGFDETVTFETPLDLDTSLYGDEAEEAQCRTLDDLPIGDYYYGEEQLPDAWDMPGYNDQVNTKFHELNDTFNYSAELFDDDQGNDGDRNQNADGHIVLKENRPDRTLVVVNAYTPTCGNGIVDRSHGETCDDGNTANGDGCSATCTFEELTCEQLEGQQGWYGEYFNYNKSHPDMDLPRSQWPDHPASGPAGSAWDRDWYDDEFFRFARVDADLNFGSDFFPFDIGPEELDDASNGPHDYHFGVHWSGVVSNNLNNDVRTLSMTSDDDAWLYVNGDLVLNNSGIHPPQTVTGDVALSKGDVIDVYFAERHVKQSSFSLDLDGAQVDAYREDCTSFNYTCEEGVAYLNTEEDAASKLYFINESNGMTSEQQTFAGDFDPVLASDSEGTLYAMKTAGELGILESDGTFTSIGDTGIGRAVAMDFSYDGRLFVLDQNDDNLYEVDPSDASTTTLKEDIADVEGGDHVIRGDGNIVYADTGGNVFLINGTGFNVIESWSLTDDNDVNNAQVTSLGFYEGRYYAVDRNDANTKRLLAFTLDPFDVTVQGTSNVYEYGDATTCPATPQEAPVCEGEERLLETAPYPADHVDSADQGTQQDGDAITGDRSDASNALNFNDADGNFFSLGFGGTITVRFTDPIQNGYGPDVRVWEDTYGAPYPTEQATVEASKDGSTWVELGTADNSNLANDHTANDFDLGSLDKAKYIRVTDATDTGLFTSLPNADGFDVNGIWSLQNATFCVTEETFCNPERNLVTNGDFETPTVDNSFGWDVFVNGTNWTTSWRENTTEFNATLELHRGVNGWSANTGDQHAELDADFDGPSGSINGEPASVVIEQFVDTIPGETYKVEFAFSPRPGTGVSDNVLGAVWNGDPLSFVSIGNGTGLSDTDWKTETFYKVATDTETKIEFKDGGVANSEGTLLDSVQVSCVPNYGERDKDDDGYTIAEGDCDDQNPEAHPGAKTYCTFEDLNCDGTVDAKMQKCAETFESDDEEDVNGDVSNAGNPTTGSSSGGSDPVELVFQNLANSGSDGNFCEDGATSYVADVPIVYRGEQLMTQEVIKSFCTVGE